MPTEDVGVERCLGLECLPPVWGFRLRMFAVACVLQASLVEAVVSRFLHLLKISKASSAACKHEGANNY